MCDSGYDSDTEPEVPVNLKLRKKPLLAEMPWCKNFNRETETVLYTWYLYCHASQPLWMAHMKESILSKHTFQGLLLSDQKSE